MLFKHPELLYALFLLVIPVLVHLFRLRKFKTEKFTNVKFLQKASSKNRKSSRLKKWLILCTRLLLLAAVIIAFAQPYFPPDSGQVGKTQETVIYLDNSYSMQARGSNGILLKRSIQELLENMPKEAVFSLFTNDSEFRNVTIAGLQNELQQLPYSPDQLDWNSIQLKAEKLLSGRQGSFGNFIAVSDFQNITGTEPIETGVETTTRIVRLKPETQTNISLDTMYVSQQTLDETEIMVKIRGHGNPSEEVPVSLYSDRELIAKKTVVLDEELSAETTFNLTENEFTRGRISLDDNGLLFDNQLFFSINKTDPVQVVVINNADDSFLRRIFSEPEFELQSFPEDQVDFNILSRANLVVLNEPERISTPLAGSLKNLLQDDVHLVVIPSQEAEMVTYNNFFRETGLPVFREQTVQEKLITEISYEHPLYESVFDEQVHNFQYPKVQAYYRTNRKEIPVLSYENGEAFLFQKENVFVFTAPLNLENSNFQRSPLIVPTLYNTGNMALKPPRLYYISGNGSKVDINTSTGKNDILKISSSEASFIPRQQKYPNKVELYLEEMPREAGHFSVVTDTTTLRTLSFNIDRRESELNYNEPQASEDVKIHSSIPEAFREIESENEINALWKWFVIFGLFFLLVELLILKFLK